jgi:hypothetical protein
LTTTVRQDPAQALAAADGCPPGQLEGDWLAAGVHSMERVEACIKHHSWCLSVCMESACLLTQDDDNIVEQESSQVVTSERIGLYLIFARQP